MPKNETLLAHRTLVENQNNKNGDDNDGKTDHNALSIRRCGLRFYRRLDCIARGPYLSSSEYLHILCSYVVSDVYPRLSSPFLKGPHWPEWKMQGHLPT